MKSRRTGQSKVLEEAGSMWNLSPSPSGKREDLLSLSVRCSQSDESHRGTKETNSDMTPISFGQLLRSSLVNNRTQAKVAEELGMQEYAITNDKTKRPVALRTKTLADLLECEC